jgi:hypothetical protein
MDKKYNLDENLVEYFQFTLFGNLYNFRYMNTLEAEKMIEVQDDPEKSKEYLMSFIKPVDEKAESFQEASKKMILPQWTKFAEMIKSEVGGGNASS